MPETWATTNGRSALAEPAVSTGDETLTAERALEIYRLMVRSRALEERMIKMSKSGEGYFWIGGPGEEAFNACLGLQIKKGQGPEFDFLHLHYRNSATMIASVRGKIQGLKVSDAPKPSIADKTEMAGVSMPSP